MAGYTLYTSQTAPEPVPEVTEAVQQVEAGSYTTLDGQPFELTTADNTLTVAISWASWCPECQAELTKAMALADAYSSQGVTVIAMNRAETPVRIEQYLQAVMPELTSSPVVVVADPTDHLFASVGGYTAPETLILSPEGALVHHVHGVMDESTVRAIIERALGE
jgi:thiol-disulfide isomerase/thioredoxin